MIIRRITTYFFYFQLGFVSVILSQNTAEMERYFFKKINIEEGLSQSSILSILQDKNGFIWFGTANGLNRYDGYEFLVYTNNPGDSTSISDNKINSLFEDSEGILWIGTSSGILSKFDPETEIFTHFDIARSSDWFSSEEEKYYTYPITFSRNKSGTITTIAQDSLGNLWIGTWGKGLIRFNPNTYKKKYFYHFKNKKNSLSSNKITKIFVDSNNEMWIGTFGGGLNKVTFSNRKKLEQPKFREINKKELGFSIGHRITSIYEDSKKNLWIGSYGNGVSVLTYNKNSIYSHDSTNSIEGLRFNFVSSEINSKIMAIVEDKDSNIWIGTFGNGLHKYDTKRKKLYHFYADKRDPSSISENEIQSLLVDSSGILWIGSQLGGGINKLELNKNKFLTIPVLTEKGKSLNDNIIWSIYEDSYKDLYIGTYRGGLNKVNRNRNTFTYMGKDKINDVHVRSVIEDKERNLWIGTYSGGLTFFNRKENSFRNFSYDKNNPEGISSNQVQALLIENDTILWVGTFGGGLGKVSLTNFYKTGKLKFQTFQHNPTDPYSLSDDRIYCLRMSKKGELWIGTHGGGINKYDSLENKFLSYSFSKNLSGSSNYDKILVLEEISDSNFLVGTFGEGLFKFNTVENKFQNINKLNGLDCNDVYGILAEQGKGYWISTDKGIYKLSTNLNSFRKFDLEDGLQSLEFNGGAYFKSKDGTFYFGGINGVNYFQPQLMQISNYIPKVVITKISVFDKPIKGAKKKLVFTREQNYFSFEFASLDFENPDKNKYKYMLKGLDKQYSFSDSKNRKVFYTNIDPGDYTFIVHGTNSDGIWSPYTASVDITILAPFWMRWWFIAGLILLVGGLITFYINQRIRYLVAMDKLKTNLSADLHDNVGAGLTEISILSELASNYLEKPNLISKHLNQISQLSRQLVESMSDIVWVVNPKMDSLYDLIVRLKDNYGELLSELGITLQTSNLEKLRNVKLVMEYRQNLYLILKESFNNCIKHSNCTKINFEISVESNKLLFKLKDNGSGFDIKKVKFGNGIKNIKERAKQINCEIKINSVENVGTTIEFEGKLK